MKISNWSKITIVILMLVCTWYGKNLDTWGKNKIIKNDVVSYYAYLPAALIFNDLNFDFTKNLPEDFEGTIWLGNAPNGKPILRMTMGLAMLWAPFFIIAHGAAHLLGESTLGYSWPYSLSIFMAALFYLFVGLFYLRKILLTYFSDVATALTMLAVVMGTNLIYYVISEPGMSHTFNFALITAFVYFSLKWLDKFLWRDVIILGVLAGLIVLIRPVNVFVLLFPALIGITNSKNFVSRISSHWVQIIVAGVFVFLIVVPQILYWKAQTGHYLFNSYMDQGKFYFDNPQILNGLFSYRKGWLVYTPVMSLAFVGLFFLRKSASKFWLPITLFLLLNIYVVFSWWCWWYGGSFGARPMIDMYGVMAIPIAAFFDKLIKNSIWRKGLATAIVLVFVGLNQFQMTQYRTSLLHWDSMTKEAYWEIFAKKSWPEDYSKLIKAPDYDKALNGEKEYPPVKKR